MRQQAPNLYGLSEFRGSKVSRSHHHGEDQLLKVSRQLRLQIMFQILQNKTKKKAQNTNQQIKLPIMDPSSSKISQNTPSHKWSYKLQPLELFACWCDFPKVRWWRFHRCLFTMFNVVLFLFLHFLKGTTQATLSLEGVFYIQVLTKSFHGFTENFNIPERVSPWKVFNRAPVAFLLKG